MNTSKFAFLAFIFVFFFSNTSHANFYSTPSAGYVMSCNTKSSAWVCGTDVGTPNTSSHNDFCPNGQSKRTSIAGGGYLYIYSDNACSPSCPANSNVAYVDQGGTSCSCKAGFVQEGKSCVVSCPSPKVANAQGVCEDPPPPPPDCKKDVILHTYAIGTNCTSPDCTIGDGSFVAIPQPTNICRDGCKYDRLIGTIKDCRAISVDNGPVVYPATAYCTSDFKGTGSDCSDVSIIIDNSKPSVPVSSTGPTKEDLNSGIPVGSPATGSGSSSGNNGGPSSGGPATNPSGPSSGGPSDGPAPSQPSSGGSVTTPAPCTSAGSDCATESTLKDVHDALTNTEGGQQQPQFTGDIFTSNDMAGLLVSNNKIQSLFRWEIPPHNGECPVLDMDIPYLGTSVSMTSHCQIVSPHSSTIRLISTISWIFLAVMVILGT